MERIFKMITVEIKKSDRLKSYYGESAFISFPYNDRIKDIVKSLRVHLFSPTTKKWEVEVEDIPKFIQRIGNSETINIITTQNVTSSGRGAVKSNTKTKPTNIDIDLKKLGINTKVLPHQLEAAAEYRSHNAMLLGDQAGLGKTLSSIIMSLDRQKEENFPCTLIICCVNDLKWNYYLEILKHTNLKPSNLRILGASFKKKSGITYNNCDQVENPLDLIAAMSIGTVKKRIEHLNEISSDPKNKVRFIITNIESIRDKGLLDTLRALIKAGFIGQIIVDEMHKIVSPTAKQTKSMLQLNAKNKVALTGTPLNTPIDLWPMMTWLGVEHSTYYAFKQHYCKMGGYENKEIVGYKNLEELYSHLDSVMLRRLKKDVLDLPDKIISTEYVEMESDQKSLYNQIHAQTAAMLDEILKSKNPLVHMLRLRQATGNLEALSRESNNQMYRNISCAKIERLKELVKERISNNEKVLIFTSWVEVVDIIKRELSEYMPLEISGRIKNKDEVKNLFQTDERYKVLVGTIDGMGTGHTLHAAQTAIFVDEPWTYSNFEQACDRIHRIGTHGTVNIITLVTKDTIDERVHCILQSKKSISEFLLNDNKMSKTERIKFLLDL